MIRAPSKSTCIHFETSAPCRRNKAHLRFFTVCALLQNYVCRKLLKCYRPSRIMFQHVVDKVKSWRTRAFTRQTRVKSQHTLVCNIAVCQAYFRYPGEQRFRGAKLNLDGLTLASEGANFDQARTILDSKVGLEEEKASLRGSE